MTFPRTDLDSSIFITPHQGPKRVFSQDTLKRPQTSALGVIQYVWNTRLLGTYVFSSGRVDGSSIPRSGCTKYEYINSIVMLSENVGRFIHLQFIVECQYNKKNNNNNNKPFLRCFYFRYFVWSISLARICERGYEADPSAVLRPSGHFISVWECCVQLILFNANFWATT